MDATKTTTLSFSDFDFSLILYALAALLIGGGGSYYIMKTDRMITAIGFFLASLAIFIYFGLRWFDGLKLRPSISGVFDPKSSWPPIINYCPDFMSLKQDGTNFYCVDTMGVTKLPRYTADSSLVFTASGTSRVNNFKLTKDTSATTYTNSFFLGGDTAGITWEGIYDGRSPSSRVPPFPTA
jgi:hypothetical protein